MKLTTKIIAGTAGLACLSLSTLSLQAGVTNVITIALTASVQGASTDNGTITTTAAPSKHAVATKDILGFLAQAEHAKGKYAAGTTFPAGAKLVVVTGSGNGGFQVLDKNNKPLVDVSDIISSVNGTMDNNIHSGKQIDANGLATPSRTALHILTIKHDDTGIAGSAGVLFYMTGFMTSTTTDATPKSGLYTESQTHTLVSGVGEGTYQGIPLVLTGSLSATGTGTLRVGQ
jgi:hypothetical protein